MNIKELLECYIEHRRDVVTRRTKFRLKEAEDRAHILEGYIIALDNLDDFVKIIRASSNKEEAKQRLMAKYPLSDRQTDAILELRLYQLTGLERGKIEAEYLELMKVIEELRAILESDTVLMALIRKELGEMKAKYTTPRRTEIIGSASEFRMEDVIPNEGCVITVSHLALIKRTPVADYRSQKRGGKGVIGAETYDEDFVESLFTASTHDYILFLTSIGQCHAKKVYDIPEGTRTSKGKSVASFLRLTEGEKIAAMICVKDFAEDRFLVMATKAGVIKRVPSPITPPAPATAASSASTSLKTTPSSAPCSPPVTTNSSSSPIRASPSASASATPRPAKTSSVPSAAILAASPACASNSRATTSTSSKSSTTTRSSSSQAKPASASAPASKIIV